MFIDSTKYSSWNELKNFQKKIYFNYHNAFTTGSNSTTGSWDKITRAPVKEGVGKTEAEKECSTRNPAPFVLQEYLEKVGDDDTYSKDLYFNGELQKGYHESDMFKESIDYAVKNLKGLYKISIDGLPPDGIALPRTIQHHSNHFQQGPCYSMLLSIDIPSEDITKCGIKVGMSRREFNHGHVLTIDPTMTYETWYQGLGHTYIEGSEPSSYRILVIVEVLKKEFNLN